AAHRHLQRARPDPLAPDGGEEIVGLGEAELAGERLQIDARRALAGYRALDEGPPRRDRACELLGVDPLPPFAARAGAREIAGLREPIARRAAGLRRDDLDPLAVVEPEVERHHHAVDLGAAAAVAEISMERVREVDRRGA